MSGKIESQAIVSILEPMVVENQRTIVRGEARILVWEILQSSDELLLQFDQPFLYLEELDKRKSEHRKREFLGARLALKCLLGYEPLVQYTQEGKPLLMNGGFFISISHSKNWMAVMIHPNSEVGIDLECSNAKIEKVYTRYLSEIEQKELYHEKEIRKLQIAWSAKEALYKMIGKTAVDFSQHLRILPFELADSGELQALHLPVLKQYLLTYIQNPTYTLVYGTALENDHESNLH